MAEMSPRQRAIAESLTKIQGRPHELVEPGEKTNDQLAFDPRVVALTIGRVWRWVMTGQEPPEGQQPDHGWAFVEQLLRVTFAGPSEAPSVNATQLADLIRGAFFRAGGAVPEIGLAQLPPREFAAWRAAAVHGYNSVLCDVESVRQNPLAERERMIVAQALDAIQPR